MIWQPVGYKLLFYGIIVIVIMMLTRLFIPPIIGNHASMIIGAFALLSGIIQSVNFAVIAKLASLEKETDLGFWARWRLQVRADERRTVSHMRALIGIAAVILTGVAAAIMRTYETLPVNPWLLGVGIGCALISLILTFLAIHEFYCIANLETDLRRKVEQQRQRDEWLESINIAGEELDDNENGQSPGGS